MPRFKTNFLQVRGKSFKGGSAAAGIATVASGTVVASVACVGVNSNDVVLLTPYGGMMGVNSFAGVSVQSLRAGAFEIACVGSRAPLAPLQVGWFVVNK